MNAAELNAAELNAAELNHMAAVASGLPVYSHHEAVTGSVIILVLCLAVLAVFGIARWRRR